ncbi:hypothetical protein G9A89_003915 [Geosiphon pyriformis]|nr:hypothetical protein G9A89_003915 [Geosiphon pyriformis]
MEPTGMSADSFGAGLTGLGTCPNRKKKHVDTVYSHSAFYKKPKVPVTGGIVDSSAGPLSLEDIGVVGVKPVVSWGSDVGSVTEKTKVATKTPNLTVLEFCHAIYTQNQSDLGLPEGCCPAESALTYYINARINYHIGKEEEPHDAKLGLYRELSQYTTKEVAVIATTIVKIHRKIEQYANKNFPISTGNTKERANKTKENLETNQESNQQKLGTPAQTPKKTKQRIYSPEDKSYHFSPENKIQIPLRAASSSTSTPQTPRTPSYIDKIKQRTADSWYQSLETKPTSFAEFKNALLEYFSDPNAVIQLQNEFNTIKQNTSETVTQYLARFNRIRRQIEAIEQGYYTDPQVLNQFIRGLKSSILGRVRPAHPNSLPEAVMLTSALESAEKEANHSQMINIVMEENKTETLEKRVMRLREELSKKIESYLIPDPRKNTYQPPQRHSQKEFKTETRACHFCKRVGHLISQCRTQMMQEARENNYYAPPQMPRNQYMPIPCQYFITYQNQGAYQQQPMIANLNWHSEAQNQPMWNQNALQTNPNYQNYQQTYLNIPENLIIRNNDSRNINRTKNSSKLSQTIPPAVATKDSSLAAIFPFELEENEAMFSGATLDEKCPITAMYTEATVNNTPIKLILNSGSARSIVTLQLVNQLSFKVDCAVMSQIITANGSTKLPHGEIDSFPFEINNIVISTKVLVIDATQYQALVGNDWLTKANATLDWTTQELLINYNGHQAKIPATCGHFQKPSANQRPTFEFEENPALPTQETPPTNRCNKEKYGYPERHGKWDEEPCLVCGEPLPRGCDWNDLPGRGGTCDATCQYMILICDWIRGGMPFEAAFNRALKRLQHYPHNEDELYNTAQAKVREGTAEEIQR